MVTDLSATMLDSVFLKESGSKSLITSGLRSLPFNKALWIYVMGHDPGAIPAGPVARFVLEDIRN